jgi:trans-aconitate 3-methyltransferase
MTTFSKVTFNVVRYASVRPTYPLQLYDLVFNYHNNHAETQWNIAIDLGCGTGQVTRELAPRFERVIAVDPSTKMLEQAREALGKEFKNVEFVQATAETLLEKAPELEEQVDMITGAQAAHWFQYPKVYTSLKRLLRPQIGTFIFWGYSEFRFTHWQQLTKMIREYSQGSDPETSLGPHWERPGRTIVDSHFDTIPMPTKEDGFRDVRKVWFTLPHYTSGEDVETHPTILKKKTNWEGLEQYLRTFSSLHTFHECYPEDKRLRVRDLEGVYRPNEGDIAQRFLGRCQDVLRNDGVLMEDEVEIEWPLSIFMAIRL